MSGEREVFQSGLRQIHGTWSDRPMSWSFSSLKDVEACPKRWALSHAEYPTLWTGSGYPSRPLVSALTGTVVHRAMELILTELKRRSRTKAEHLEIADVLRALGGLSVIIRSLCAEELKNLQDNPRTGPIIEYYRREMSNGLPEARQRLQGLLARTEFEPVRETQNIHRSEVATGSTQLSLGSHPEVTLSARSLRLFGRADLVSLDSEGCTITDFKSGAADPSHREQLRLYALLWSLDHRLNPNNVRIKSLVVTYPWGSVEFGPFSDREVGDLLDVVSARIADADTEVERRPPRARPSLENCEHCSVRQMCDEYWDEVVRQPQVALAHTQFLDVEVKVEARNGSRSWFVRRTSDGTRTLLRTPDEGVTLEPDEKLRVLGAFVGEPEPTGESAISLTKSSEIFVCG